MTLAQACLTLHGIGHVATVLHRDHLCLLERSHTWGECSAAPHFAFSAADVAELSTAADLQALIVAKLRASQNETLAPALEEGALHAQT